MPQLILECGDLKVALKLHDTATAQRLVDALPIEASASLWGDEIYFDAGVPVDREEDASQIVDPGSLCYWCEGQVVAIPFGPTPIALDGECRLIAPVNVWGRVVGDPRQLAAIAPGASVALHVQSP